MKIHLVASAYMRHDETPHMIVSMKMYDKLMKAQEKYTMEFSGLTQTAEGNHRLIFEMYGIPFPEGRAYPLPDAMKITKKESE